MAEPSTEIVRRAQVGDETALTELVTSQQNYIYSIAMGVFRDPEDAADMTQEAFIHLFRVLPSYRGETRFTTWLYRVVMNLCYDELRRRKRRPASTEEGQEELAAVPETASWSDPEQEATRSEAQAHVRAALWKLEEPYRLVLTLFFFENLKYREIAEITGIPLNTIKSHIHRGKARLAGLLSGSVDVGTGAPPPPRAPSGDRSGRRLASLSRMASMSDWAA